MSEHRHYCSIASVPDVYCCDAKCGIPCPDCPDLSHEYDGQQTAAKNATVMADVELAHMLQRTARHVLYDALLKAYPVGARIRVNVAARRYSYMTVVSHPSFESMMYGRGDVIEFECSYDATGNTKRVNVNSSCVELVTYEYRVIPMATAVAR